MQILTTADAAKTALQCYIANKTTELVLNEQYGIECGDDLLAGINRASAYVWILNSECTISTVFTCEIIEFANSVTYTLDACNPNNPCVASRSVTCDTVFTDTTSTGCFLPSNSLNIIT